MSEDIDALVSDRSLTGNLIDIRKNQKMEYDVPQLRLVRCPLPDCDHELDKWHKSRASIADHLLHEHVPEDFGLTPLRDQSDPDTVVIPTHSNAGVFHTSHCRAVIKSSSESLERINFADLDAKYRQCKYCQGKPKGDINV